MRRNPKPTPSGKKRYSVGGLITISVHTHVIASSPEEAREIALNERTMMSLCHQCASADVGEEWVISGDLDCDVPVPYEGDGGEYEVVDLDET